MEKASKLSALVESSLILRDLAKPEHGGKRALQKIKMKLPKWSHRRVKSVFYAETGTRVDADELDELRRIARQEKRAARLAQEEQEASNELSELRSRLARLEALLLAADAEFHSETLTAIRLNHARLRNVADTEK